MIGPGCLGQPPLKTAVCIPGRRAAGGQQLEAAGAPADGTAGEPRNPCPQLMQAVGRPVLQGVAG